jgi:hypothetical protein
MSFRLSKGGLATMAWVPEDREVEPCLLGILELVGEFNRALGGHL